MPRRLIRSIAAAASRVSRDRGQPAPSHFEQLEPRILFSTTGPAFIQDIVADNRGLITMEVCGDLNANTLNETSVQVFTAGADNLFGTFDDVIMARTVNYDLAAGTLIIDADIDADTRYAVRLDATIVRGLNGSLLDGEFNGAGMPTGNGLSGGSLLFYTKTAPTRIARISTNLGDIDIELFTAETPITVANFLNYANSNRYDNNIVHRSVEDFVVQTGGYLNQNNFRRNIRDAAIQNEPGISNLRGTVAFAKVGSNPNSATSEWFFNLGDNSENLDNQNGGFTVFGEITNQAGLDVMDAIAALETVNASGVNSAFTDFPVTDIDAISGNPNAITPAVTVVLERVAVLQQLSATPPEQIQAESFTFASGRDVFVTVYDLGGIGRDELDNAITVRFADNRVSSINISGDFPAGSLGIVIGDANRVGTIKDASASTSVAFIFSNAPIGSINLKGDVTGFNINGLNLGGILLADDIDSDGVYDDQTAILINSGYTNSISSNGDIVGDILAPGGLAKLTLKGSVSNSEIRIGAAPDPLMTLNGQITDASNTSLVSAIPFKSLRVDRWTVDSGSDNSAFSAPSIANLKLNGAFDVDVTLTGALDSDDATLGKLSASQGLFGATFEVNGDLDSISVKGDTGNASFNATGAIGKIKLDDVLNSTFTSADGDALRSIKLGNVTDSEITIGQEIGNFRASSWVGGSLMAEGIRTLSVTDRNGEFNADVALRAGTFDQTGLRSNKITINSVITGGVWDITGSVKVLRLQDGGDGAIRISGDLTTLSAGDLDRFDLNVGGEAKNLTTGTWFRGELVIGSFNTFTVNGDFRADLRAVHANRMAISGDLFISDLFFTQQPDFFGTYALRSLTVGGEMRDVEFRAAFRVGTIQAKAMHNTIIGVSNNIPNDSFPLPTDVDGFATIESVTITGPRNGPANFTDSYIVAASIGDIVLGEVESFNSGHDFGVGAFELGSISYFAEGETVELRNNALNESPEPFGDFEIRIGFIRFDDSGVEG